MICFLPSDYEDLSKDDVDVVECCDAATVVKDDGVEIKSGSVRKQTLDIELKYGGTSSGASSGTAGGTSSGTAGGTSSGASSGTPGGTSSGTSSGASSGTAGGTSGGTASDASCDVSATGATLCEAVTMTTMTAGSWSSQVGAVSSAEESGRLMAGPAAVCSGSGREVVHGGDAPGCGGCSGVAGRLQGGSAGTAGGGVRDGGTGEARSEKRKKVRHRTDRETVDAPLDADGEADTRDDSPADTGECETHAAYVEEAITWRVGTVWQHRTAIESKAKPPAAATAAAAPATRATSPKLSTQTLQLICRIGRAFQISPHKTSGIVRKITRAMEAGRATTSRCHSQPTTDTGRTDGDDTAAAAADDTSVKSLVELFEPRDGDDTAAMTTEDSSGGGSLLRGGQADRCGQAAAVMKRKTWHAGDRCKPAVAQQGGAGVTGAGRKARGGCLQQLAKARCSAVYPLQDGGTAKGCVRSTSLQDTSALHATRTSPHTPHIPDQRPARARRLHGKSHPLTRLCAEQTRSPFYNTM